MPDPSDSPGQSRGAWLEIDLVEDGGDWSAVGPVEDLARRAAAAVAAASPFNAAGRTQGQAMACIALSDDANVRILNRTYRGKDKATNVLSFPAHDGAATAAAGPRPIGDIVLAAETVAREALQQGIPFAHHFQHLVVHGLLHLLGYDHEADEDAARMEGLETAILSTLGIADPYADGEPADTLRTTIRS